MSHNLTRLTAELGRVFDAERRVESEEFLLKVGGFLGEIRHFYKGTGFWEEQAANILFNLTEGKQMELPYAKEQLGVLLNRLLPKRSGGSYEEDLVVSNGSYGWRSETERHYDDELVGLRPESFAGDVKLAYMKKLLSLSRASNTSGSSRDCMKAAINILESLIASEELRGGKFGSSKNYFEVNPAMAKSMITGILASTGFGLTIKSNSELSHVLTEM